MKFAALACLMIVASCAPKSGPTAVGTLGRPQPRNAGPRIAAYCVAKSGQRVGNGECWTLADEAFKSAGASRPGTDPRVWGREVNPANEPLKPGDVVEFRSARFADGTFTRGAHTAVVVKGGNQAHFSIAEQNWGRRTVRVRETSLQFLLAGKVTVYRTQ